ncbi:MAG: lysostaphin resistance A-like protein [Phycisphaerales bacterium]
MADIIAGSGRGRLTTCDRLKTAAFSLAVPLTRPRVSAGSTIDSRSRRCLRHFGTDLRTDQWHTAASVAALLFAAATALAADAAAPAGKTAASPGGVGSIGSIVSLLLLIFGAGVWIWIGARFKRVGPALLESVRLEELSRPGGVTIPFVPGAAMVLAGLAVWLVQPAGAAFASALVNAAAPIGPDQTAPALRAQVIAQAGAHAAAAIMIALIVFMLPGLWRAMGATLAGCGDSSSADAVRAVSAPPTVAARALTNIRESFVWTLLVGPAVYVVGSLSLWAARAIAAWSGRALPGDVAHDTLNKLAQPAASGSEALWWWATVLGVTVGAPIIEEFIYRGLIQTGLLRLTRSAPVAIIGTSLPFALAHAGAVESHALLTLFVLSLGFGLALEKTGKLWVCVLMHAAFNGANIALAMVR